jgi:hypothetical protein
MSFKAFLKINRNLKIFDEKNQKDISLLICKLINWISKIIILFYLKIKLNFNIFHIHIRLVYKLLEYINNVLANLNGIY